MSMKNWSEREVEIACKKENPNRKEGEFDYGCACYESALKAFKSLMQDGHSGMSIVFTKNILNRLIEGKPLTPIEDTEDVWNEISESNEVKKYQSNRMYSLFKTVTKEGKISYNDIDRVVCVDLNNPKNCWHSGLADRIINELYPITMPYYPGKAIKVYCEDLLFDEKNGDFDTVGIINAILPAGDIIEIKRFFKEEENDYKEISYEEYLERKKSVSVES